ncbi:MAG: hypothetical protein GY774_16415 [Planctomycetes bacterium]|nr:hypothetical protein [Planctomycetota bacterium]
MQNKYNDLNDILFAQLNKLSKAGIKGEKLTEEIDRARAVTDVAKRMIENGRLSLDVLKLKAEYNGLPGKLPIMLEGGNKNGKKKN